MNTLRAIVALLMLASQVSGAWAAVSPVGGDETHDHAAMQHGDMGHDNAGHGDDDCPCGADCRCDDQCNDRCPVPVAHLPSVGAPARASVRDHPAGNARVQTPAPPHRPRLIRPPGPLLV